VPNQASPVSLDELLAQYGAQVDEWTRAALAESISPEAERTLVAAFRDWLP